MKVKSYSAALESQIREKEYRDQSQRDFEYSFEPAPETFGRPGAGAPLLDPQNGEIKAHLKRQFYRERLDFDQLHDRDELYAITTRAEYKSELDKQRDETSRVVRFPTLPCL